MHFYLLLVLGDGPALTDVNTVQKLTDILAPDQARLMDVGGWKGGDEKKEGKGGEERKEKGKGEGKVEEKEGEEEKEGRKKEEKEGGGEEENKIYRKNIPVWET